MISQPYSLTHSISHSLTSVGKHQERNIKKQETSSLKKTNKHQESLTQKPRENQEQESRFQSSPSPSLSPPLWFFFFFWFMVWVLLFVGFCLGFKVSASLCFVLRDLWVSWFGSSSWLLGFVVWFKVSGFGFCSSWLVLFVIYGLQGRIRNRVCKTQFQVLHIFNSINKIMIYKYEWYYWTYYNNLKN